MKKESKISLSLVFLIFSIICITLLSYAYLINAYNDYQYRSLSLHLPEALYAKNSLYSFLVMMGVLALCLFTKFQNFYIQRLLLIFLTIGMLIVPLNIYFFPLYSGLPNAINELGNAWLQLVVPHQFRGTITGIVEGLAGYFDIGSIYFEDKSSFLHIRLDLIYIAIAVSLIIFYFTTRQLENTAVSNKLNPQASESIVGMLIKYPHVFIACFILGFNDGILYYSLDLARALWPNKSPQTYQYILFVSGIIGPMLIGTFSDKIGRNTSILLVTPLLALCKLASTGLIVLKAHDSIAFYVMASLESAFAVSMWSLVYSLLGEKFDRIGLFRSFCLSTIAIGIGTSTYALLFRKYSPSFALIELTTGLINVLLFVLFYFSSRHRDS